MEKYFKRKQPSSSDDIGVECSNRNTFSDKPVSTPSMPKLVDLDNLPWDPAERIRILDYHPNQRDEIRRIYWVRGPFQPEGHQFSSRNIGNRERCFNGKWFKDFRNWLEYSVIEEKAFCLCCYLCRDYVENRGGSDAFVTRGFNCWNKPKRLRDHVGEVNSFHNKALECCENLVKQKQSIGVALHKQDDITKKENRVRLNGTIDACRITLKCALAFRGHDEKETSLFRGNFLEIYDYTISQNDELRRIVEASGNNKLTSPSIQKDIVKCFEEEILESIFNEIGHDVFSLLVDESSDVSQKEQMAIVLRYVDIHGLVKERFVGLVHVMETSSLTLKSSIDTFFTKHKLSLKQLRGQGYDGASNMRGEYNGLKAKILEENNSAYYVHCFSHQLQLVVVAVARKHLGVVNFFDKLCVLMNVVGASCKRKDMIRELEKERLKKDIRSGLVETGSGLNQELSLIRPGDTR